MIRWPKVNVLNLKQMAGETKCAASSSGYDFRPKYVRYGRPIDFLTNSDDLTD